MGIMDPASPIHDAKDILLDAWDEILCEIKAETGPPGVIMQ